MLSPSRGGHKTRLFASHRSTARLAPRLHPRLSLSHLRQRRRLLQLAAAPIQPPRMLRANHKSEYLQISPLLFVLQNICSNERKLFTTKNKSQARHASTSARLACFALVRTLLFAYLINVVAVVKMRVVKRRVDSHFFFVNFVKRITFVVGLWRRDVR